MAQVLQEITVTNEWRIDRPQDAKVSFEDFRFDVRVVPLNGLVDLNRASVGLLQALLIHGAGMDDAAAGKLAEVIVQRRSTALPQGGSSLFDAIEDLLQIPGIDYEVYARLAPLVTVRTGGSGQVNPYAAPPAVLAALASGNQAVVHAFLNVRDAGQVDLSGFNSAYLTLGGSTGLRLYAQPETNAEFKPVVICDVNLTRQTARAAPWNFLQCSYQATLTW